MKLLAIDFSPTSGKFSGLGKSQLANPSGSGIEVFSNFISSAIGLMTIIAIIWFVFVFFTGAIAIVGAGGDKQALESARKKITTGIIGLVVTVLAIFIIKLIGSLIGFQNILDLTSMFNQITGVK